MLFQVAYQFKKSGMSDSQRYPLFLTLILIYFFIKTKNNK